MPLAALLMMYVIWHLRMVVQVNILDPVIYFSCSGIMSDGFQSAGSRSGSYSFWARNVTTGLRFLICQVWLV